MKNVIFLFLVAFAVSQGDALAQKDNTPENKIGYEEYHEKALSISEERKKSVVNVDDFLAMIAEEGTVLLDVRSDGSYNYEHVKGAINLTAADLTEEHLSKIVPSKDTRIVIYCDDSLYPSARRAISLTQDTFPTIYMLGYENLYELQPGYVSGPEELSKLPIIKGNSE